MQKETSGLGGFSSHHLFFTMKSKFTGIFLSSLSHGAVYRILVPSIWIEPETPEMEVRGLNHGTAREVPNSNLGSLFYCGINK